MGSKIGESQIDDGNKLNVRRELGGELSDPKGTDPGGTS